MTRKNIYEVLDLDKVNINIEYGRLYYLFYTKNYYSFIGGTIENAAASNFMKFDDKIKRRCVSFKDFNQTNGFNYKSLTTCSNIDTLVSFCEYIINLVQQLTKLYCSEIIFNEIRKQVDMCTEAINYKQVEIKGFTCFTKKDPIVEEVAASLDNELVPMVWEYNHWNLKGNLKEKENILIQLYKNIENDRDEIEDYNKSLEKEYFMLMNAIIRHNNDNRGYLDDINDKELEDIYDDIYKMWILCKAILQRNRLSNTTKDLVKKIG